MSTRPPDRLPDPADGTLDLREFARNVWRHKWLVIGVVALAVLLAAAYSYTRPSVYQATSSVLVRPIRVMPDDTDPTDNVVMETEAQLVRSTEVATIAKRLMDDPRTVQQLLPRVSVAIPENTEILAISFTDSDAVLARDGAQRFAEGYLDFKTQQAINGIKDASEPIYDLINEEVGRQQILQDQIDVLPEDDPERIPLESLLASSKRIESGLQDQIVALATSSRDPGEVVQHALVPSTPISPKHEVDLALGAFLGIIAGVVLAALREQLRDRVDDPSVFRRAIGAPVLGVIPESSLLRGSVPDLVTIDDPRSPVAEAYRTLRTNLLAVSKRSKIRTVLLTAARPHEGTTSTAVNLAVTIAQADRSVVLISADLRSPRAHLLLGVGNERGLGQVLADELPLNEAIVDTAIPRLQLIPPGPVSEFDEPVELLQSARMFDVIRRCRQADFVIVEGPALESVADSLVLAGLVEGVVLVADAHHGTRAGIALARNHIEQVGGEVLGGVLNRVRGGKAIGAIGSTRGERLPAGIDGDGFDGRTDGGSSRSTGTTVRV